MACTPDAALAVGTKRSYGTLKAKTTSLILMPFEFLRNIRASDITKDLEKETLVVIHWAKTLETFGNLELYGTYRTSRQTMLKKQTIPANFPLH